jgi:hypothetical protein
VGASCASFQVLRFAIDSRDPLRSGCVYRYKDGGGRDIFVCITESIEFRCDFGEAVVLVGAGTSAAVSKPVPPARSRTLADIAASEQPAAKAFRLCAADDAESWVGLCRVDEVIEASCGGEGELKSSGWTSSSELKQF